MTTPDDPTVRLQLPTQPPQPVVSSSPPKQQRRVTRTFKNLARPTPAPAPAPPEKRRWLSGHRPRVTPPTQAELDTLPVKDRQELYDTRRQRPWQHLTSLGVLFGVLFTAGGLVYTAKTWETGQETLRTTQQQQITDRYTRAVEQIGADKSVEVRIGGLYALGRITRDSSADATTVEEIMVAYILEHDGKTGATRTFTPSEDVPSWKPGADVRTAVRVLGTIPRAGWGTPILFTADFVSADWRGVNLRDAYLSYANLSRARLNVADLASADLSHTVLTRVNLFGARLSDANLIGANLTEAELIHAYLADAVLTDAYLADAVLTGAVLTGANLTGADLNGAKLTGADLRGAVLTGADLTEAHLNGADLRNAKGMSPEQIRKVAITDSTTKF
ncbi:pentapeptide repeat-containing protein [Nonomuraea basaltis]|uniref:pentapeptide repeat-containing protein n=1 Tax=Nonomuraea basaltis TaxID=2495887 RepID=UPI00110C54DE|nr:pentapeptide repeat-containing protein [Nonomuraea basaltis]TMR97520.1 pentapeptide repeat-containing protein [Nonomuraea basaltis]